MNVGSVDQSTNVAHGGAVFQDLRAALASIPSEEDRATLQDAVNRMEGATGDPGSFKAAYQDFVSLAANHMTIVAPFIPALSMLL